MMKQTHDNLSMLSFSSPTILTNIYTVQLIQAVKNKLLVMILFPIFCLFLFHL